MPRLAVPILAVPILAVLILAAAPAAAAPLAAHRALYKLTLHSSQDQGVLAAHGTMSFDLVDACAGWTTSQHLVIDLTDRDGRDMRMVSDYATYETKDGGRLDFHTRQTTDDAVTEQLDGTAVIDRSGRGSHAEFNGAEHRRVPLPPGTELPNAHTTSILEAGKQGKRFLSIPLFDGTVADGAQDTFVTLENWQHSHSEKWSALATLPSGRVHVAFFNRDNTSETPEYEAGMRYFDNGVADDLAMNFGDFILDGKLDQFELHTPPRC